jgi:uncharacterized protein (TIGR02246 family)
MQRRPALVCVFASLAVIALPSRAVDAPEEAIRATVRDYYAAFNSLDRERYRKLVTDDYRLLENGELLDFDGDVAAMPSPALHATRTDHFDFRQVRVDGDSAYVVYFLASDTRDDDKGARSRRWLESAVLRRVDGRWRVAVLHSTQVPTAP